MPTGLAPCALALRLHGPSLSVDTSTLAWLLNMSSAAANEKLARVNPSIQFAANICIFGLVTVQY